MPAAKAPGVVILTDRFPFPGGEVFFRSEVEVLRQHFERVLILPMNPGENPMPLPEGLEYVFEDRFFPTRGQQFSFLLRNLHRVIGALFTDFRLERRKKLAWKYLKPNIFRITLFLHHGNILHRIMREKGMEGMPVYCYWCNDWVTTVSLLRRRRSIPFAATRLHGFDLFEEQMLDGYYPLRALQFRGMDLLAPVSDAGKDYLSRKFPEVAARTHVYRLGTDDQGVQETPPPSDALRIVSCGTVEPHKRVLLLAESLALLDFPVEWTHYGCGSQMEALREIVARFPAHVRADLRGCIPHAEIMDGYRSRPADMFLHVSMLEGVPVSIMEALSFGIPVLATDAGGTREIAGPETGRLIPVGTDAAGIAQYIREFRSQLQQDPGMRARARAFWEQHYHAPLNHARFYEALR